VLARRSGIHDRRIREIEHGRCDVSADEMSRLAEALDLDVSMFLAALSAFVVDDAGSQPAAASPLDGGAGV
jgi:transcriptional regulator with XRE-family HTH domain